MEWTPPADLDGRVMGCCSAIVSPADGRGYITIDYSSRLDAASKSATHRWFKSLIGALQHGV